MTTVKKIARHKVRNIEPGLQAALTEIEGGMTASDLAPLSAYLCMTGQSMTGKCLRGRHGSRLAIGYLAALYSKRLIGPQTVASSYMRARRFKRSVETLGCRVRIPLSITRVPDALEEEVKEFEARDLIDEEVWRWSGWPISSSGGVTQYLHLDPVYEVLGRKFVEHLHAVWKTYKRSRKGATLGSASYFVAFIEHLGDSTSQEMWLRQNNVDRYIREFGEFYFRRADQEQLDLRSKACTWNLEVKYLFSALAHRGAIAKPGIEVPTLPIGEGETSRGSTMLVDSALLDMRPGLKDHQLKDLMYNRLTESVELLTQWANKEVKQIWNRWLKAQRLAKVGSPRRFRADGFSTASTLADASWDRDCCATYAEYGHAMHKYTGSSRSAITLAKHVYGRDAEIVLETACIPTRGSLLPHATLLVAAHPEVTTSMLETLEVEETPGGLRVVRGEGAHRYTMMYKARKGPDGAETKVKLTARTAQLLDQVLALTEPLRTYLRSINDQEWRKLFLSTSGLSTKPTVENFSATCTRREEILKVRARIQRLTGMSRLKVQKLTEHFTLRTLRATMGTLVYLRTGSTEAMASALGHSGHSTQLIDKYLPKQIRTMVEEYWIRSFQMSLMATALKSSSALKVVLNGADPIALMESVRFDFVDSVKKRRVSPASQGSEGKKRLVVEVSDNSLTEMIVFNERLARSQTSSGDEMFLGSFVRTLVRLIDQTTNRPDWTAMLSRSREAAAKHTKRALQ